MMFRKNSLTKNSIPKRRGRFKRTVIRANSEIIKAANSYELEKEKRKERKARRKSFPVDSTRVDLVPSSLDSAKGKSTRKNAPQHAEIARSVEAAHS